MVLVRPRTTSDAGRVRRQAPSWTRAGSWREGSARAGRTTLVTTVLILLLVGVPFLHGMQKSAEQRGIGHVEPSLLDFAVLPEWADSRWGEELNLVAGAYPGFAADDELALEGLRAEIEALSFVEAVEALHVVWPDALRLELKLRRPVACVPVDGGFLLVAEDGTLLSGYWPAPPRTGRGYLPVIGPMEDSRWVFADAQADDYLCEDEHIAALDVALSMAEHLGPLERQRLGRCVIDARDADSLDLELGGIRIDLEGRRRILFGRSPYADAPGELEARAKWRSVSRALSLADQGQEWDLVDVRWDRPAIGLLAASDESEATDELGSATAR